MKRILVATDGSEGAGRAVEYAARRAKDDDAELWIVNVMGGHGLPEQVVRAFTRAQHAWLDELLESLSAETLTDARQRAQKLGVSAVRLESRSGEPAAAIIEIAQEKKIDEIIVGKRGAGLVAGLLLGSVSHKLVSLSPMPITVIP